MLMRLFVPLDGSTLAETAVAPAAALALRALAPVTVVLARVNPIPSAMIAQYAPLSLPVAYEDGEATCRAYLHQIAQHDDLCGLTVAINVATGLPDLEIRDIVRRQKIDLIIMTSHGRGGIAQSRWGNVAQAIVHTCGIPTLVLRQQHVEAHGVAACSSVQQGEPALIIEQMAHQLDPAMLALATHGCVGLDQVLHGSTTQTLFHQLTLPILVMHPVLTPEGVAIHAIRNAVSSQRHEQWETIPVNRYDERHHLSARARLITRATMSSWDNAMQTDCFTAVAIT